MAASIDFSSILMPEGPWDETDVPAHQRGVRLGWIEEFVRHIYAPHVKRWERQLEKRDEAERINHQSGLFDGFQPRFVAVDDIRSFQLTTRKLVSDYVVPLTMASKAPLYSRVPAGERGTPTVFLSHAWSSLVLDIPTLDQVVRGTLDAFLAALTNDRTTASREAPEALVKSARITRMRAGLVAAGTSRC